jgi:hypothetical protein
MDKQYQQLEIIGRFVASIDITKDNMAMAGFGNRG